MSDFYKYKVGDIIYLKDSEKHTLGRADIYTGIILSVNMHKDWWGGGYYKVYWSEEPFTKGDNAISIGSVIQWKDNKEAEIYEI